VLDEVVEVTGLYCEFVSDMLTTLMSHAFSGKITFKSFIVPDAPEAQAERVHFFLHPPSNLEQRIAGHADSRTTKLYDRRGQKVLVEDMERIRY